MKIFRCVLVVLLVFFAWSGVTASLARAEGEKNLLVAVDPRHVGELESWIAMLKSNEITVTILAPEKFDDLKTVTHGLVFSVPKADDATLGLLKGPFTDDEVAFLAQVPNKSLSVKRNVWKPGQEILYFVANSPEALNSLRVNTKSKWWSYICSWFDIVDEGLHGY